MEEIDVSGATVFQKTKFSMLTPEVDEYLKNKEGKTAVLYGIEVRKRTRIIIVENKNKSEKNS